MSSKNTIITTDRVIKRSDDNRPKFMRNDEKKRKKERKSSSENNASSSSSSSESSVSEKTKMQVLPIAAKKTHICGHVGVKLKSQECNSERNTTKVEIRVGVLQIM
ncbi:hypothetical protein Y032_0798g2408 [Ancylostoma ceylanicum]|uniref:Uncharacterized protein n=1 Tax=Ancylostoma ceylanicum TaxID=53326 RepID=A0A016WCM9_9BILA|nr:hypothetical protein Y032_0798g2408 [Ancylostoma ceylanicum]